MKRLVFDSEKCVGCGVCELVCSGTWQRVYNPHKANLRVHPTQWYGGFTATVCEQRENAECVEVCPTGALFHDREKGIVRYSKKDCDGCQLCVEACPVSAIFTHPDIRTVFKCDLCGGGATQRCVEACPRGALSVTEVSA